MGKRRVERKGGEEWDRRTKGRGRREEAGEVET